MFIILYDSWEPFRLCWTFPTSYSATVSGDVTCLQISPSLAAGAAADMQMEKSTGSPL